MFSLRRLAVAFCLALGLLSAVPMAATAGLPDFDSSVGHSFGFEVDGVASGGASFATSVTVGFSPRR